MVSIKSLTVATMAFTSTALAATGARITYYTNQDASNVARGSCELKSITAPYGAAIGPTDNGNKQACGKCINVHYGGKTVKVEVVDLCQECPPNGLDLWTPAFEALAPTSVGVLSADWEWVAC